MYVNVEVNVQKMHDKLCMETTNLKLSDKLMTSDQVQIEQQTNSIHPTTGNQAQTNHSQYPYSQPIFISDFNNDNQININGNMTANGRSLTFGDNINSNINSNINNNLINSNITNNSINTDNYTPVFTNLDQSTYQPSQNKLIKIEMVQDENMNISYPENEFNQLNKDIQTDNQTNRNSNGTSKICRVCGDKSLGYNFSQVTCESCKAFFRRNALRNKQFKCPFTENCEIDVVTRRFCQKCRLRKCFEIGMKSEWILSDDEKRLKRLKIEENKKKRRTKQLTSSTNYTPSPYSTTIENSNFLNGSLQSNSSTNNSFIATSSTKTTSPIMISDTNSLNPIIYDDSNMNNDLNGMQLTPTFHNQFDKNQANYYNNPSSQESIQQPEIFNQLVYSHYEQYKSNGDNNYDQISLNSSPYYSSSFNSTRISSIDQFFSGNDSTTNPATSPSVYNSSTISSPPVNSPLSISNVGSNIVQNEFSPSKQTDLELNEQQQKESKKDYLLENNGQQQQSNQFHEYNLIKPQPLNNDTKRPISIHNKTFAINCLPDNLMIDEIFEEAIASKLNPLCSCKASFTTINSFSSNEISIINEILYSTSDVGCVMNAFVNNEDVPAESVIFELLRMTDYAVRKSVEVAKKISFFRDLCEEDQISALKGSSTEMMLCRTINLYEEETDTIVKRDVVGGPKIRLDILKRIKDEIYNDHKEMILSFKKELRSDATLVSILMIILLFQPDRPNIQHRTTMKYVQTIYRYVLKRYIYVNFSKDNMPIYNSLLQNLVKLRSLNEKYIKAYLDLNADILGPLLMEVFDFGG